MHVDCVWNVMAHAQKPDFVFRRNGLVHLNRRVCQFSRLLAAEVCASAVVMRDTPCSEVVWRVLATRAIRQFPLHFPSPASPCAITFQLDSTSNTDIAPPSAPSKVCENKLSIIRHCWQIALRKVCRYIGVCPRVSAALWKGNWVFVGYIHAVSDKLRKLPGNLYITFFWTTFSVPGIN